LTALPETLRQAVRWETTKNVYLTSGLCDRCAAQAAWAHQNHGDNWTTIHSPCGRCGPIVAQFPHKTPSQDWRKLNPQRLSKVPVSADAAEVANGLHAAQQSPIEALA
jgi:hypothetical protein